MKIKKTSGTSILNGNVVDSLDENSTTNAPSINAVNKANTYSTEEVKTGETWIDGKPIYRKVVNFKSTTSPYQYVHGINNIETVIKWEGYTLRNDETTPFRAMNTYSTIYPAYFLTLDSIDKTKIEIFAGDNVKNSVTWFVIVYYTKTTDEEIV